MGKFYNAVRERMIRYAEINTESAPFAGKWPTTERQFDLARELEKELRELGAEEVWLDEKCCVVYAKLPSNLTEGEERMAKPVGFVTHMDTAPDAPGENVRPWVLENYGGGDIVLNKELDIVMRAADFPNLEQYIGQDLILTDGTTLLGGDDKAAVAAVMTMAEYYLRHPEAKHGRICLAFTPDEEVGGLARDLDLERFGSPYAYTLDGDHLGWYEDETFNASGAEISIRGRSVHTGTAKGIMINAVDIAAEFMQMLPEGERPQYTDGTDGFYHMVSCQATCEHAELVMIIRDFDAGSFARRERFLEECAALLNRKYGEGCVSIRIEEQYRNMKEVIDTVPELVRNLKQAIRESGITPVCEPFRGGTDGSALSFRGLPCPNLSAGYENAHGRFEYVPVQSIEKNTEILIRLCGIFSGQTDGCLK